MEKTYTQHLEKTLHSIKYEGNLYKRGRGKKFSFVKPWSIRKFVLDTSSGEFSYYKDVDGTLVRKGRIDVSDAVTARATKEESGKEYSFKVSVGNEDLYLACSNDQDIDMWIDAINYCAKNDLLKSRRRSSSKPDREFFLDPPNPPNKYQEDQQLSNGEQGNKDNLTHPGVIIEDEDDDESILPGTEQNHDGNDKLADVNDLRIRAISTDGTTIPTPDFNAVVRKLPSGNEAEEDFCENNETDIEKEEIYYNDSQLQVKEEDEEFPPLEERFQEILLSVSDFDIDLDHGVCGTGAFGVVYKATRKADNKIFALKFFGYAKRDPINLDILETEIDVMLKLKGFDVFAQIEGFFYDTYEGLVPGKKFIDAYPDAMHRRHVVIVMEYLEQDLLSFLSVSSSKVIATTLPNVFRELVEGLQCLHEKRFLHRDLKVDNVMMSAGKVKLIDFGFLCSLPDGEEEFLGPQTGTIGYFAPESIPLSGYSKFSVKSDIWQAGVILYTLVSGKMPFNISSFNIRKAKYPPLVCPKWETRPECVKDLIGNILILNPDDRLSTNEILQHEWLRIPSVPLEDEKDENVDANAHEQYLASIKHLIQRRNIKKILQMIHDDPEGSFDRSFKAESIMDAVEITGGATYFMFRLGSLKSLIFQNMSQIFNLYDSINYTQYYQLMAKNRLQEMANVEMFSRFCHENGYCKDTEGNAPATSSDTVTIMELLLTLISLIGTSDQDDNALACFLRFDTKNQGFLEKDAMIHIFRSLLEEEAATVAADKSNDIDSELDNIENELKEIEEVFSFVEVKEGHPGIDFVEFKMFHDSVMKISTRVSSRLSMRSMSVVSNAVGKFTESLHSIRIKKQNEQAQTAKAGGSNRTALKKPPQDLSKTM